MATTPTDRQTALARRMRVDIDTATYPASNYERLEGISELKPITDLRTESDETYDDEGAARDAVTGYNWRLELKLLHSTNAAGTSVDPVHAFLRTKFLASRASAVAAGEFGVRYYDRNGLTGDSHEGRAYVKNWGPEGGNGGAQDIITLVIQGQGPLADITNPAANLTPTISALSPTGGSTAGGTMVNIYGNHFATVTGAGGVKFDATNATSYVIVSDSHIVAIAPADTAGTINVTVTNPTGTSSTAGTADEYTYA